MSGAPERDSNPRGRLKRPVVSPYLKPASNVPPQKVTTGLHAGPSTQDAVESFILSRQVMGCTRATLGYYRETLGRFTLPQPPFGSATLSRSKAS